MSGLPYSSGARDALLADLNLAQREAVVHGSGPLLVVAGAGTGKTRVLTRRAAWLVAGGLPSRSVLAITFTNKAARVLRDRLAELLGVGGGVWAGTFHAFGAWMLRRHGEAVGITSDYTILDRTDQRRLLRDLLRDPGSASSALTPAEVAEMISHVKNGGGGGAPVDLSDPEIEGLFTRVSAAYAERLRAGNLVDFDDLLLQARTLLREHEEVAECYRSRFAHVLVDEYQDTNVVQADLLQGLLGAARNLMVVGDPDQSIYRWRGAAIRNILSFEDVYPGARKVVLEQNYRSTKHILDAAEHVIERNAQRHAKRLFTEREEGAQICVVACADPDDEAEAVASRLEAWHETGCGLGEMAVFYRVNAISRALEMALLARRIPYVVVASVEFFQRREVKDLLAYARLVENPTDEAAFLRIANVPRRGVGDQSLKKLRWAAQDAGLASVEAARQGLGGVSGRARKGLERLLRLLDELRERPRAPVGPLLGELAERSGYLTWLQEQADDNVLARGENVEELVNFAHEFDRREADADLRSFLERAALVSDQDGVEDAPERVSLMSVHAAKGLEFDNVVIAGAEDGLFPHSRSQDSPAALEEERRLFYVAMTRARQRLAITYSADRFDWRGGGDRLPSPYLHDIPPGVVERDDRADDDEMVFLDRVRETAAPEMVTREDGAMPNIGERVRHPYFGDGWMADRRGAGPDMRVTVNFDQFGPKQLLLRHARLERIS